MNEWAICRARWGRAKAARQYHEKSLSIAEQLVKQEPGRADYQFDLSISYNKLGDLQSALGEARRRASITKSRLCCASN